MKLSTMLKLMSGVVILLSVITMASVFWLRFSFDEQREAVSRQAEFKQLGLDLVNSFALLTEEAREYSIFGEKGHYDNYLKEINETKTRERVVQRLQELQAPEEELALIQQSISNMGELTKQQEEAFAAIEAKDLAKARLLVFGSLYKSKENAVMDPIKAFQNQMNVRAEKEAQAAISKFQWIAIAMQAMIILLIVSVLYTFYLIYRKVNKPLQKVTQVANQVAAGNLAVTSLDSKSKDEIGMLGRSVNEMVSNLRQLIEQVRESTEQVAASSEELSASIEESAKTTNHINQTVQDMARGAETQVDGAKAGESSLRELTAGIQRVAETSSFVSKASRETAKQAEQGNESIQKAVRQISLINDSVTDLSDVIKLLGERSGAIGQIVEVINSIASQTNLLALNAAIEAARAGEHGRGFAVVADEVRKLAEQSQQSAGQITELIHVIQTDTTKAIEVMESGTREVELGQKLIAEAGEAFTHILQAARHVAQQINDVSSASVQMSAGSEEAAASVAKMTQIAVESASNANEIASASEQQLASIQQIAATADSLSQMAQELSDVLKKFHL